MNRNPSIVLGRGTGRVQHTAVAIGGTFDVIHVGHVRLFERAFKLSSRVFIGVSSDNLVKKLGKTHAVRPFDARVRDLRKFLASMGWLDRARIVELRDRFGPASRRKRLDALIVSEETRSAGRQVNAIRKRRGLHPLKIYVVKLVRDDVGKPVSATRIRSGEIDSFGRRANSARRKLRL